MGCVRESRALARCASSSIHGHDTTHHSPANGKPAQAAATDLCSRLGRGFLAGVFRFHVTTRLNYKRNNISPALNNINK